MFTKYKIMRSSLHVHKKPRNPDPSKLLKKFVNEIILNSNGPIVDVACGYGRNAAYIASHGVPVICIDNNIDALNAIRNGSNLTTAKLKNPELLSTIQLDLVHDPWPFQDETLGTIINVHFFIPNLLKHFIKSLTIGGYLFIETINGHGDNYLELPPQKLVEDELTDLFEVKYLKIKKIGPVNSDAVTVKLFAIKTKRA